MSINRATIMGNLGRDPEVRTTANGDKVCNLRVATSEKWRDRNSGEQKEHTEWHQVTVWGDGLVGVVERHLAKGSRVYVEGQLQTRKWQDQSGADRYTTEIVVRGFGGRVEIVDFKSDRTSSQSGSDAYREASGGRMGDEIGDDIPF